MKETICFVLSITSLAFLCFPAEAQHESGLACIGKDSAAYVTGGKECLVYKAFGREVAGPSPSLFVFLHGDVSAGGPADYMYSHAERLARPGIVNAVLLRPEYYDTEGRKSTGSNYGRRDNYTADNIDAIADAIGRLKDRFNAKRVLLIGHSGGSVVAGVILGRHPNLAAGAMLIACPCDLDFFHSDRRRRGGPYASLSPHRFVDRVPNETRIIVLSGERDTVVRPDISRGYAELLAAKGIKAEFRQIPEAAHGFNALAASAVFSDAFGIFLRDVGL